jgi:hypothetical protein
MPHLVTVTAGTTLPKCKRCGDKVRFVPIVAAEPIEADVDFLHDFAAWRTPQNYGQGVSSPSIFRISWVRASKRLSLNIGAGHSSKQVRGDLFASKNIMVKKRGNSNWGKPNLNDGSQAGPSSFEEIVKRLGLSPDDYEDSAQLKAWAQKNKDQKYVPPNLLQAWNIRQKD